MSITVVGFDSQDEWHTLQSVFFFYEQNRQD